MATPPLFLLAVLTAASAEAATISIVLQPVGASLPPSEVEIVAVPVSGDATSLRQTLRQGAGRLAVPQPGLWRITCDAELWWCPATTLALGAETTSATLPVFPASSVSGRIVVSRGEPLPRGLLVQTVVDLGPRQERLASSDETIIDSDQLRLKLPKAKLDIRLATPGFGPVYRWDFDARQNKDLGSLEFRRGGSVSAFVTDPVSEAPVGGVSTTLAPLEEAPYSETLSPRQKERMVWTRRVLRTDARGFVQFAGVRQGLYRLEITAAGRPATAIEPVEVHEDAETRLDNVTLRDFARLGVTLSPALDPQHQPWNVQLRPIDRGQRVVVQADRIGHARFGKLIPGRYLLEVLTPSGSRLASQEEEVDADRQVSVAIPLVPITGRLRLGEKPLAAEIRVLTGESDEARLASDPAGRFQGWIRKPRWDFLFVMVNSEDPPLARRLEIKNPPVSSDEVQLDIQLDERVLAGRVVDETGRPLEAIRVAAEVFEADHIETTTTSEGRFELRGLQKRLYTVYAHGPMMGASDAVVVDAAAEALPEVTLVVPETRKLEGLVLSADGQPVAAAAVEVEPAGRVLPKHRVLTDASGRFEKRIAGEAERAVVRVRAPSHHLWSGCVTIPPEGPVVIALPSLPSSVLEIRPSTEPSAYPRRGGRLVLLTAEGGVLDWGDLASWAQERTGRSYQRLADGTEGLVVPGVAPGAYALIWSTLPPWDLAVQACALGAPEGARWEGAAPGMRAILVEPRKPQD